MATFLVRAFNIEEGDQAFEFTDIAGNTHEENIRLLASVGVTAGCATEPLRYCPDAPVTRGQMATFLVRAMGLAQSLPDPNPGDTVDCEDFTTQGEAQVFFDSYYPYYGDVAMLDDGNSPLVACESLPADPWRYLKDIDPIDDEVSPWVWVSGTKDGAADWEDRPYLGGHLLGPVREPARELLHRNGVRRVPLLPERRPGNRVLAGIRGGQQHVPPAPA